MQNAIALGFVVPQTFYSIAMAVGSVVCYMWSWKHVVSFDMYMFAVAVGVVNLSTLSSYLAGLRLVWSLAKALGVCSRPC